MYLRWVLYYIPSLFMTLVGWILSPILAMCVRKEYRLDVVKRFDKHVLGFDRYYLWKQLNWFQTHDNACDEYFWGVYGDSDKVSIEDYIDSSLLRYWYRICWLCRNPAYGFGHTVLGFPRDDSTITDNFIWKSFEITTWTNSSGRRAFNIKGNLFLTKSYYLSINIGWKAHKEFSRLMQADRLLSIPRKVET